MLCALLNSSATALSYRLISKDFHIERFPLTATPRAPQAGREILYFFFRRRRAMDDHSFYCTACVRTAKPCMPHRSFRPIALLKHIPPFFWCIVPAQALFPTSAPAYPSKAPGADSKTCHLRALHALPIPF